MRRVDLGPFRIRVARSPVRLAVEMGGRTILAERARRDSAAVALLDASLWRPLGDRLSVEERGKDRAVVTAALPHDPAPVVMDLRREDRSGVTVLVVSIDDARALAIRQDLVPGHGEAFFPPPDGPRVIPGVLSAGSARGGLRERLLLSSRGYGIHLEAPQGSATRAFRPDPDSLRLEAAGSAYRMRLLPGSPKDALRALAILGLLPAEGVEPPRPGAVESWEGLREAVTRALGSSLLSPKLPPLAAASGVRDPELRARVLLASAFLSPIVPEPSGAPDAPSAGALPPGVQGLLASLFDRHSADWKKEGLGAVRPLVVEHPSEPEAWKEAGEWLLGPDLVVAPVLEAGKPSREVWLPPGSWMAVRSADGAPDVVRGPTRLRVDLSLDGIEIGLFVRESAPALSKEIREAFALAR